MTIAGRQARDRFALTAMLCPPCTGLGTNGRACDKNAMTAWRILALTMVACALPSISALGAVALSSNFIVHFGLGSTRIDEPGRRILDAVIEIERQYPGQIWRLAAYTDRVGSIPYNRVLACRRAEAVRDYLIRGGVPPEDLSIAVFGEMRFAVETADEVDNGWNRRVEISVDVPQYRLPQTRDRQGRPICR